MTFDEYQTRAVSTAIYPDNYKVVYPTIGLSGEAGEVAEKVKKLIRDKQGCWTIDDAAEIKKELGDVMWYVANIAADLNIKLSDVAKTNLDKLNSRMIRGKLQGNGDNR